MRRFILSFIILPGLVSGCVYQRPDGRDIGVGDKIPSFALVLEDGSSLSSDQFLGAPALLVFFHTTCPDCQRTLPVVQRLYERFGNAVRFVAISRGENAASVRAWWDQQGITLPFSAQEDRQIYELFASSRIPRVYIVDSQGTVRASYDDNPCPQYEQLLRDLETLASDQVH